MTDTPTSAGAHARQRTLTNHLLARVLAALLLVWASFIVVGMRTGIHEADELTDGHLASVASLLVGQSTGQVIARQGVATPALADLKAHDYQQSLTIVVWEGGRMVTRTGDAPVPLFSPNEGFEDLSLGDPPARWRTYSQWAGPDHTRKIMVLLSLKERDDLAADIAEQMAEPGLWLLPIIALVLGLAIRRGLRPLVDLSRDVHALDVTQAAVLRTNYPHLELRRVVDAINTLLGRQSAALSREREVAGDLAHELRTPLASIALQARSLRGTTDPAERDVLLTRLEQDALRAGHVLAHLLALARASRTALAESARRLDLADLARRVLAEYAQAAVDSGHELAFSGSAHCDVEGHAVLLEVALRNLIENALAHTPRGTSVEVQVDATRRWLQVCDDGRHRAAALAEQASAVPPAEWGLGLGLGHRVVEKIASIHHATLQRVAGPPGFDTCYRLSFNAPDRALDEAVSKSPDPGREV